MKHDFTSPEPSPLTPGQMAASLGLMDDIDTQILRVGVFYKELQPFWESVKQTLQELIDGTVDKGNLQDCAPFTIYTACKDEGWDSAEKFKDVFAYQIGKVSGIISDISLDLTDSMESSLGEDRE